MLPAHCMLSRSCYALPGVACTSVIARAAPGIRAQELHETFAEVGRRGGLPWCMCRVTCLPCGKQGSPQCVARWLAGWCQGGLCSAGEEAGGPDQGPAARDQHAQPGRHCAESADSWRRLLLITVSAIQSWHSEMLTRCSILCSIVSRAFCGMETLSSAQSSFLWCAASYTGAAEPRLPWAAAQNVKCGR